MTLQYGEGMHNPVVNNFNYDNDREGTKCPVLAHIRQINPRTHQDEERRHRIARRGITYGKRQPKLEDRPQEGVGLLFMCFQSNITEQFEFLQHNAIGRDPIISKGQPQRQTWPARWSEPDTPMVELPFYGFVTLKGGEYFFAPSMSTLPAHVKAPESLQASWFLVWQDEATRHERLQMCLVDDARRRQKH